MSGKKRVIHIFKIGEAVHSAISGEEARAICGVTKRIERDDFNFDLNQHGCLKCLDIEKRIAPSLPISDLKGPRTWEETLEHAFEDMWASVFTVPFTVTSASGFTTSYTARYTVNFPSKTKRSKDGAGDAS